MPASHWKWYNPLCARRSLPASRLETNPLTLIPDWKLMMRKIWLSAALLALLVLAACASAAPTPTTAPMACTLQSVFGDPIDPASVKLPEVTADDWSRGPDDARLMLVEYSNFQLPTHDKAPLSAQAAEAAGLQGKFWEMHDLLFAETNWDAWTAMSVDDFQTW